MKKPFQLLAILMVAAGLQACGGGGGGGGFPVGGLPPLQTEAVALSVSANGKVIDSTPPTDGRSFPEYRVKPGDKIEIVANQAVRWTPDNDHGVDEAISMSDYSFSGVDPKYGERGFVKFRNLNISGTKWSAQIINIDPESAQGYVFTAVLASVPQGGSYTERQHASFFLKVDAGNPKNATYNFFNAAGIAKKLRVDFDSNIYELFGKTGGKLTGSFTSDANESGTYLVGGQGGTNPVNLARFRFSSGSSPAYGRASDIIVGAVPAEDKASPQPFIAVARRAAPLTASELRGDYNRFSIERTPTAAVSAVNQFRISNDGALLELCSDHYVFSVAGCSPSSLKSYAIASAPEGFWRATNLADSRDTEVFFAARMNGETTILSAGVPAANPAAPVFRVGLPVQSSWHDVVAYGPSNVGSWNKTVIKGSALNREHVRSDGSQGKVDFSIKDLGNRSDLKDVSASGPASESYIGIQSARLSLLIGAPTPASTGILQINLND